jgi:type IX secretion system PorP/SprF family membrane protein
MIEKQNRETMNVTFHTHHKTCLTLVLCLLGIIGINTKVKGQQSASYTQYMDNLTPLNSAYSLLDKAASLNTLFRTQYVGIQGAPNTFIFNGNLPLDNIDAATGLIINNDNFAVEHQTEINAYFAKSVQLSEGNFLSVSLNAGFRNYIADYAGLAPGDPVFADDIRETKASAGFGVLYYTDKYYIGVSVPQLTFRDLGEGSILDNNYFRNHYYFSAAYLATLDDEGDIKLKPATLVSYTRGVPLIADISGSLYFKNAFEVGVDYRTNNEMAAIIAYNFQNFHLGYAYQFGTTSNNLGGLNNATYEITLSYRFGKGSGMPKGL